MTATSTTDLPTTPPERTRCMPPINILKWVEEHRDELKPPVGNKYLYDGDGFFVMVIAGPNARNDFHVTNSEEYFYQVKGDIVVRIQEDGAIKDIPVCEGETFFIPSGVPHSPTRGPGSIGVVVELRRPAGVIEHQQFYCGQCDTLVYDKKFDCDDIVKHFAQSMEDFWSDPELNKCPKCGHQNYRPTPIKEIIFEPEVKIIREGD
ncbi:MAG: 3-hydroxyanthranilate 3,4-dioxygenase [Planctomycetota bacterium]|nr:3-hydroxyanthranilate 3,4-dioxygenase [Planctomycetota bacterium]